MVYEDPWLAGGHNGLSNNENPREPEAPFPRVLELRRLMRAVGLDHVPIVMAGGVWHLKDWKDWIGNPDLGPIAFQFGTRPLLTHESPIPESWKKRLLDLLPGDVLLHRFSPTGFYSSAVKNRFLDGLVGRSDRQVAYAERRIRARAHQFLRLRPHGPRRLSDAPRIMRRSWAGSRRASLSRCAPPTRR